MLNHCQVLVQVRPRRLGMICMVMNDDETYNTPGIGSSSALCTCGTGSLYALSELSSYLDSDTKTKLSPDFNILRCY